MNRQSSCKNGHKPKHRKTTTKIGPTTIKNWCKEDKRNIKRRVYAEDSRLFYSTGDARPTLGDLFKKFNIIVRSVK